MASNRIRGDPETQVVVLDTNAVLMLFEFSVDFSSELTRLLGRYRLIVPSVVVRELQVLSTTRGPGTRQMHAKAALRFIQNIEIVKAEGRTGDDAVFFLAKQMKATVVTNDKNLRTRLRSEGLQVVFLRGKQTLCME